MVLRHALKPVLLGVGLASVSVWVSPSFADDLLLSTKPVTTWVVSVGGMATFGPDYAGSRVLSPGFMPSISWRKSDEPESFSAPEDGLDLTAYDTPQFKTGATFSFDGGRYRAGNARLSGLNDVQWTVDSGVFFEYWPINNRFRTRMEVMHGFRRTDGFVVNFSADWVQKYGQFTLSGGPRLSMADHNEMESRFGVTAPEAAVSNFSVYNARAGVKSTGVGLAQSYNINPNWTGTLYQHYDRLVGTASDSPLVVNGGSRNQFTLGAGLTYSFNLGW